MKLKKTLKILLYTGLSLVAVFLLAVIGLWSWLDWEDRVPSERHVRQQFESHRADYVQFVTLLRKEQAPASVSKSGEITGANGRVVPEYRDLLRKIGAQSAAIGENGSIKFELWARGCVICDDSAMGVLYLPKDRPKPSDPGRSPTMVSSLDSGKLPQERGAVASGYYILPVEPEWFIYRYEYQE